MLISAKHYRKGSRRDISRPLSGALRASCLSLRAGQWATDETALEAALSWLRSIRAHGQPPALDGDRLELTDSGPLSETRWTFRVCGGPDSPLQGLRRVRRTFRSFKRREGANPRRAR